MSKEENKNLKFTFYAILETILEYSSTLENTVSSVFDKISKINGEEKLRLKSKMDIDQNNFEDFFKFCAKKFKIDDDILVLTMMNIDKIISNNNFQLTFQNINRFFYTCLMVTQKYYEDNAYNNKLYADLVGISCNELLEMEMEYMNLADYQLFIKDDDFQKYKRKMSEL
jgi:hypothetical protein